MTESTKERSDSPGPTTGPWDPAIVGTPNAAPGRRTSGARFTIGQLHAQGGLGQVSLAIDGQLKRSVALKEIRPDRRTDQARRRFVNEAEITGQLEHPGIVPIYALETDAAGEPYYAMRFIQGQPLSEAIRQYHVPPGSAHQSSRDTASLLFRDLLQRFVSVCQTMAYAHSKGVIHRDLKPANVMLGEYGETLVVDWGLAKRLTDATGRLNPEEAGVMDSSLSADPLSSKATLPVAPGSTQPGKALGTPAYMAPEQARGEWARVGPAADIFSLGAILYELLTNHWPFQGADVGEVVANAQAGRFAVPRKVKPDVPKPLEAVCLKAMAFRPQDRYPTAKDLATDVEHWLGDEPVSAYREPWTARAGRWMRRHRSVVTGGVVTLAALTSLAIVVALEREHAREAIAAEQVETQRQKDRALVRGDQARKAIEAVTSDAAIEQLGREKSLRKDQQQFLQTMIGYYEAFAQEAPATPEERLRQASAFAHIGQMNRVLGRTKDGEQALRRAVALAAGLVSDFPQSPEYRAELASMRGNLGNLLTDLGQHQEAAANFHGAVDLERQLLQDFPNVVEYHQKLATSQGNLALLLANTGQTSEALAAYHAAIAARERLVVEAPNVPEYRQELANAQNNLANLLKSLNQLRQAAGAYGAALAVRDRLAKEFPAVPRYRQELAHTHNNLGSLLAMLGEAKESVAEYRAAVATEENLVADFPSVPRYRFDLTVSQSSLGLMLAYTKQPAEAVAVYRSALATQEKLVADFPALPEYRQELARTHHSLGLALTDLGQKDEALAAYRTALAWRDRLAKEFPRVPDYRQELAITHNNLGALLSDLGRKQEAHNAFEAALSLKEQLVTDFPDAPAFRTDLANGYTNMGNLARDAGKVEESLSWYAKSIALVESQVARDSRLLNERLALRAAYWNRAQSLGRLGRHKDAAEDWGNALAVNTEPQFQPWFRSYRALSRAHAGGHAQAFAEADEIARNSDAPNNLLYNLACVCSVASAAAKEAKDAGADAPRLAEQYAARAIELLRQAIAKGYKDIEHLKKDEDLKVLREREDYQKLLCELDKSND